MHKLIWDLGFWILNLGGMYSTKFKAQGIDEVSLLPKLSDNDWHLLGIMIGQKVKILKAIKK